MNIEIWKDILELDGHYQISNLGNVKSKSRSVVSSVQKNGARMTKEKPKLPQNNGKGYMQLYVQIKGKRTMLYIHRLVALYFIPNPDNKSEVNHIDGDKSNNHVSNLEWTTMEENRHHAKVNNLLSKGETSGTNKLTEKQVLEIREKGTNRTRGNFTKLAIEYGVRDSTIHKIINRERWKHI